MSSGKQTSEISRAYTEYLSTEDEGPLLSAVLLYFKKLASKFKCPAGMGDEVCQQAIVKIWRRLHLYKPEKSSFSTWSHRVWVNTRLNYIRDQKNATKNIVPLDGNL